MTKHCISKTGKALSYLFFNIFFINFSPISLNPLTSDEYLNMKKKKMIYTGSTDYNIGLDLFENQPSEQKVKEITYNISI